MSDLVRVKLDTGAEVTVGREFAAIHQLEVLDVPAVDARGTALDGKPLRTIEEAAEAADRRTPAQKAADTRREKKEQADAEAALEVERQAARERAQAEADAANAAANDTGSPSGDAESTEENR